jgi:hypothetical protein
MRGEGLEADWGLEAWTGFMEGMTHLWDNANGKR